MASLKKPAAVQQKSPSAPKRNAQLPRLDAGDGDLPHISALAWEALKSKNDPPRFFRMGDQIVRLKEAGLDGLMVTERVDLDEMKYEVTRAAKWYRWDGHKRTPTSPRKEIIADMLATPCPPLPYLERVVWLPVFAPDGSLVVTPGYHSGARIYYAPPTGFEIPKVSKAPTRGETTQAIRLIEEALCNFPFVGAADKAHAIELTLLPFVRAVIPGPTPLHTIEKPTPGTGGTLLARVCGLIGTGREPDELTEGENDAEWRKRITTLLLGSPAMVLLDNVEGTLRSAALSSVLTVWPNWRDRLLGTNKAPSLPNRAAWVATANSPKSSTQIARRCVRIRIDSQSERPEDRTGFRHPDLIQWVKDHRAHLAWACLTIIQAWVARGRPLWQGVAIGSYEAWRGVMGGILDVAGVKGFLANYNQSRRQGDGEQEAWSLFVRKWWKKHRSKRVSASPLVPLAVDAGIDAGDGTDRAQATRLGQALQERRDRRIGRFLIKKAEARSEDRCDWYLLRKDDTPDTLSPRVSTPTTTVKLRLQKHEKGVRGVMRIQKGLNRTGTAVQPRRSRPAKGWRRRDNFQE
jgi:putative DNA primase/helicase